MSLRAKFILYLVAVHLIFSAATAVLLDERRYLLLALEAFFVLSLVVGIVLVRKLFEPIRLIRSGIEFIKAHEFATRFREVGQPELDPLIRVYNMMADSLREERIRSEEQEHFLQRIIAASPSGILTLDLDGRVAMANEAALSLLQAARDGLIGKKLDQLDTSFARALAGLAEDEPRLIALHGSRRIRCQALHFMDRGFARRFILLDELTDELFRSEKGAYEKLIRTMSHEINNTTSAVASLLESCLHYREQIDEADRDDFAHALGVAISRTGRMNQFMREFADVVRLPAPNKQDVDVERLLRDVVFLLKGRPAERRVTWRWEIDPQFPPVRMDAAQMEQVFINVLKNSLEAMGEDGVVTIRAGRAGGRLFVAIRDDGGGIPQDVQDFLFTPFFSSKKDGRGIGLTFVREVLLRHDFDFTLENVEPGGAEFTVYFQR